MATNQTLKISGRRVILIVSVKIKIVSSGHLPGVRCPSRERERIGRRKSADLVYVRSEKNFPQGSPTYLPTYPDRARESLK